MAWFRKKRKRVLILSHEHEHPEKYTIMALGKLAEVWKRDGLEVVSHSGTVSPPAADLVFLHVDLSVVPEEYAACAGSYPASINARVLDIRKRRFSEILLSPKDDYEGRVIAKSDYNSNGKSELRLLRDPGYLCPFQSYSVFDRLSDVPDAWWEHPRVIVEKFLPETEGPFFFLREYLFLGDEELWIRLKSPVPLVKGQEAVHYEEIPPDPAIRAIREEYGFDYGKFDYVVRDGKPLLLDINKTQGAGLIGFTAYAKSNERRARGIHAFLPPPR